MSKPIRVYQCKDDCCLVRIPSKRFWVKEASGVKETTSNFRDAIMFASDDAEQLRRELPTMEPTA